MGEILTPGNIIVFVIVAIGLIVGVRRAVGERRGVTLPQEKLLPLHLLEHSPNRGDGGELPRLERPPLPYLRKPVKGISEYR